MIKSIFFSTGILAFFLFFSCSMAPSSSSDGGGSPSTLTTNSMTPAPGSTIATGATISASVDYSIGGFSGSGSYYIAIIALQSGTSYLEFAQHTVSSASGTVTIGGTLNTSGLTQPYQITIELCQNTGPSTAKRLAKVGPITYN